MMVVRWCYDDDDDGGVGVVVAARGCGDLVDQVTRNNFWVRPENSSEKFSDGDGGGQWLPKIERERERRCIDDEASNHEDASNTSATPKQQQLVIPQTTAISNIKLPILKKKEYDIWAMEMEHYLEYIDNEVWKKFKLLKRRGRLRISC
ncbi:hypothetical protein Tco_0179350 [Tanacetum coccineum]